jgi:hypothetical protein
LTKIAERPYPKIIPRGEAISKNVIHWDFYFSFPKQSDHTGKNIQKNTWNRPVKNLHIARIIYIFDRVNSIREAILKDIQTIKMYFG